MPRKSSTNALNYFPSLATKYYLINYGPTTISSLTQIDSLMTKPPSRHYRAERFTSVWPDPALHGPRFNEHVDGVSLPALFISSHHLRFGLIYWINPWQSRALRPAPSPPPRWPQTCCTADHQQPSQSADERKVLFGTLLLPGFTFPFH